jgi:hypothetical protein
MLLYNSDATLSDPDEAAELLEVPPGRWTDVARLAIASASAEPSIE